ncbi:MAG: hypothetical protein M3275_14045 [Thermoproteota archaeon]|nr:hypothetical protein [Thermoproteota archaeon]
MEKVALFLAVTLFLSFLAFNLPSVLAHEEVVMGDISIVAGWVDEPPLVNQLNGIVLIVTQVSNGQPVNNALAQADITLQKGGETRPLEFQPSEEAGTYTATILPTQTGQYTLVMRGTIAGQAIDGQIEIEDVEDTARFSFPPATTNSSSGNNQIPQGLIEQLQRVITDLTAQVEEANVVAQEASNATQSVTESIEELKTSADRAYLFSLIGVGAGAAGIAIGVVALSRREKI